MPDVLTKTSDTTSAWAQRDQLPAYAPECDNSWELALCMYARDPATRHKVTADLHKTAHGDQDFHLGGFGESTQIGYDGAAYNITDAIPWQAGLALAAMMGGIRVAQGYCQFVAAGSTAVQSNVVQGSPGFLIGDNFLWTNAAAGSFVASSLVSGTVVALGYSNLSTSGFITKIDGVAQAGITTTGASTFGIKLYTGLDDTTHTLEVDSAAGQSIVVFGMACYNPAVKSVYIHIQAIGGTWANGSTAGKNWSNTGSSPAGLGLTGPGIITAAGVTLNLQTWSIGNNDAAGASPAATINTGLTNTRGYFPTVPALYIHPPKVTGTGDPLFDDLSGRFFSFADAQKLAGNPTTCFLWDEFVGRLTGYNADGCPGADAIHPKAFHQWEIGRHIARCVIDDWSYAAMQPQGVTAWAATTAFRAYQAVQLPTGGIAYSARDITTRAAFDATERARWVFRPGGHVERVLATGNWLCPTGITQALAAVQGGGGGGGGGGAATAGTGTLQTGGGGGGAGAHNEFNIAALVGGTNYAVTVGVAGASGAGAAAPNTAGVAGGNGGESNITGPGGTVYRGFGGAGGQNGAANSAAARNGGYYGLPTSLIATVTPGCGGITSTLGGFETIGIDGVIGGSGGGAATAALGGLGGNARTTPGARATAQGAGGSGTVNGTAGQSATELGCGGAGGGGASGAGAGGTGGAGGLGAAGYVEMRY